MRDGRDRRKRAVQHGSDYVELYGTYFDQLAGTGHQRGTETNTAQKSISAEYGVRQLGH